jgi:hypothetical protein
MGSKNFDGLPVSLGQMRSFYSVTDAGLKNPDGTQAADTLLIEGIHFNVVYLDAPTVSAL